MDDYDYEYDYEETLVAPATVPVFGARETTAIQVVYENCIQPSIASIIPSISDLLMYNLLFNILTQTGEASLGLPERVT